MKSRKTTKAKRKRQGKKMKTMHDENGMECIFVEKDGKCPICKDSGEDGKLEASYEKCEFCSNEHQLLKCNNCGEDFLDEAAVNCMVEAHYAGHEELPTLLRERKH